MNIIITVPFHKQDIVRSIHCVAIMQLNEHIDLCMNLEFLSTVVKLPQTQGY